MVVKEKELVSLLMRILMRSKGMNIERIIIEIKEHCVRMEERLNNHLKHHERIENRLLYPVGVVVLGAIILRILQAVKILPNF